MSDKDENETKERHTYHLPSAITSLSARTEMTAIASYMKDTHLEDAFGNLCHAFLSQPKLPYNPYPGFIQRLRHLMHVFQLVDPFANSQSHCKRTNIPCMYGLQDCDNVWGVRHMVNFMDGKGLKQYDWLVQNVTPKVIAGIADYTGYTGQILAALVGPAAFTGSMYAGVESVDIRLEYVMYGPDVEVGVALFVKSIVDDIEMIINKECPHQMLSVTVPFIEADNSSHKKTSKSSSTKLTTVASTNSNAALTGRPSHNALLNTKSIDTTVSSTSTKQNPKSAEPSLPDVWSVQDIVSRKEEFVGAIGRAVKHKQLITQECVFALNEERSIYTHGSKQYVLHFIETSEDSEEESLHSFAELPYLTIHQGVFLKKSDCETYMQTMTRYPAISRVLDTAETTHTSDLRSQQLVSHMDRVGGLDRVDSVEDRVAYLDEVVEPIKLKLQQLLSTLDPVMDSFKAVHLVLNLVLLERTKWKDDVLVEIHQFINSTAHQWHVAMSYNTTIQTILASTLYQQDGYSQQEDKIVRTLMTQYKKSLLHVFDTSLHDRPSDQCTVHSILQPKLQKMTADLEADVVDKRQVMQDLISVQLYSTAVSLQLVEDASSLLKQVNLQDLIKETHSRMKLDVKSTSSKADIKKKKSKSQLSHSQKSSLAVIRHGVEDKKITQQKNQFVEVEEARKNSNCPRIMATEAVLLQYLIDVKLDQIWQEFLLDLLSKPWLPPNPYPSLVTHLKQATLRLQLCHETNKKLSDRLLHLQSIKVVNETFSVCNIPGSDAYGCDSALVCLDTNTAGFSKIATVAKGVIRKLSLSRKGQFQLSHGVAISDLCPLYGQLVPYLHELILQEYYYIKGPMGACDEAISLFAKLIYDQVVEIFEQGLIVTLGVSFENSGLFPIQQIVDNKEQFIAQLTQAVHQQQHVYIKLYQGIGWRYLGIKKYLCFHYLYVDRAEDRCDAYYPLSPIQLYQNVFLTRKEASFHLQHIKLHPKTHVIETIDKEIRHVMKNGRDMMQVFKLLLTRDLINKDAVCIAELWRVLHSIAFQLDYVASLNQALQELIQAAIDDPQLVTPLLNSTKSKDKRPAKIYPLKEETIIELYQAFSSKIIDILQDQCAFAPKSLLQFVKTRLSEIADVNALYVPGALLKIEVIGVLQDISDILQPIKDIITKDLLQICPETHDILSEIMNTY